MIRPSTRHGLRSVSSSSTSQINVSLSPDLSPLSLFSNTSNLNKKIENNNNKNLSLIDKANDKDEKVKKNYFNQSNNKPYIENEEFDDKFTQQLHNLMKRRLNTTKNVYSNLSKDNDLSLVSITEIPKTETLRHDSFIKKQSIIFENKKNAEVLTETNNSRKSSIASLKKTNVVDQIDYGNDKKEFSQNLTSESESPISPIKSNETQKLFNNHYCLSDANLNPNAKDNKNNKSINLLNNKRNLLPKLPDVKQSNSLIDITNKKNINNLNRFSTSTLTKSTKTQLSNIKTQKFSFSSESFADRNFKNSYDIWLKKKLEIDAKQRQIKMEDQIKKEKQKEEKKCEAEKCFNQWKKKYDNEMSKKSKKKLKNEQTEKERHKELLNEKKQNAEKTFEYWKKKHYESLQLQHQRLATAEKIRAEKKMKQKIEKKLEADQTFNEWLQHKNKLYEKNINASKFKKEQIENEIQEKENKKKLAQEAYNLWLKMKNEELKYSKSLAYKILEFESEAKKRWPTTPWLPTNNTVERKFISTGHRRMTLEKPIKLKAYKRTRSFH